MSVESGRRLVAKERVPGRRFDLYVGQFPETFVDGVAGVHVSTTVSKLDFYKITKNELDPETPDELEPVETREVAFRVIIPTPQFVEFLVNYIAGMKQHEQTLVEAFEKQTEAVKALITRTLPNAPS
jgi:hypothetical protein